jgi:hypothetical protein
VAAQNPACASVGQNLHKPRFVFDSLPHGSVDVVIPADGIILSGRLVIDGRIKVVGKPTFPWYSGEEFYRKLEKEYPLRA